MKKVYLSIHCRALALLVGLLAAGPGAWAQGSSPKTPATAVIGAAPAGPTAANQFNPASISNKIQYHGQVPDTQTNYRADPLDVCPNVVDPANPSLIAGQPYQFQFESNCVGNSASTDCRFRPNFIWTIHYYTEAGNEYTEQWQDQTAGDFSKIRLYMYDRVPGSVTPTNGQATQAGGNNNFSRVPYPNTGCLQAPNNTAAVGEAVTWVRLECTGYSCGYFQGDDTDQIQVRYYNRRVSSISVANNPTEYCRDQAYTLNWAGPLGATGYNVTANNGAQVSNISGTSATLSLAGVPRTATSVTVSVTAVNSGNPCGTPLSASRTFTLPVRRPPAQPTNMALDGSCPSTTNKTVSITGVSVPAGQPVSSVDYHWYLTSNTAAAYLIDNLTNQPTQDAGFNRTNVTYMRLVTPQNGSVTVNVEARASECGGPGLVLSNTFQIGNIAPTCPTATATYGPCGDLTLTFSGAPAGLSYYITRQPYNITVPGGTASVDTSPPPTATARALTTSSTFSRAQFDIDVLVTSPCAPAGNPGYESCVPVHVVVPKFLGVAPGCRQAAAPERAAAPATPSFLYPNPATAVVLIQPDVPTQYQWVKVLNLQGRVVLEQRAQTGRGLSSFDVHELPAGLYQVQLFDGQKLTTQRLQKD